MLDNLSHIFNLASPFALIMLDMLLVLSASDSGLRQHSFGYKYSHAPRLDTVTPPSESIVLRSDQSSSLTAHYVRPEITSQRKLLEASAG